MGYNIPNEASEASPPPYTSTDPAVSNQRVAPQPPTEEPVDGNLEKKQLHENPPDYGGNPRVGPDKSPSCPIVRLQERGSRAAAASIPSQYLSYHQESVQLRLIPQLVLLSLLSLLGRFPRSAGRHPILHPIIPIRISLRPRGQQGPRRHGSSIPGSAEAADPHDIGFGS